MFVDVPLTTFESPESVVVVGVGQIFGRNIVALVVLCDVNRKLVYHLINIYGRNICDLSGKLEFDCSVFVIDRKLPFQEILQLLKELCE